MKASLALLFSLAITANASRPTIQRALAAAESKGVDVPFGQLPQQVQKAIWLGELQAGGVLVRRVGSCPAGCSLIITIGEVEMPPVQVSGYDAPGYAQNYIDETNMDPTAIKLSNAKDMLPRFMGRDTAWHLDCSADGFIATLSGGRTVTIPWDNLGHAGGLHRFSAHSGGEFARVFWSFFKDKLDAGIIGAHLYPCRFTNEMTYLILPGFGMVQLDEDVPCNAKKILISKKIHTSDKEAQAKFAATFTGDFGESLGLKGVPGTDYGYDKYYAYVNLRDEKDTYTCGTVKWGGCQ